METEFLAWQNEVEVVLSALTDGQLLAVKEVLKEYVRQGTYLEKRFPLSAGELNHLVATIDFSYWCRRGKGVRIVCGEVEVCELVDSPFYLRYKEGGQSERCVEDDGGGVESGAYEDKAGEGRRRKESEGEVEIEEGEWV